MLRNDKEYPCELSPTGNCKYGGGKSFNYGFMHGSQSWCREPKTNRAVFSFIGADLICPLYGAKNTEPDNICEATKKEKNNVLSYEN